MVVGTELTRLTASLPHSLKSTVLYVPNVPQDNPHMILIANCQVNSESTFLLPYLPANVARDSLLTALRAVALNGRGKWLATSAIGLSLATWAWIYIPKPVKQPGTNESVTPYADFSDMNVWYTITISVDARCKWNRGNCTEGLQRHPFRLSKQHGRWHRSLLHSFGTARRSPKYSWAQLCHMGASRGIKRRLARCSLAFLARSAPSFSVKKGGIEIPPPCSRKKSSTNG
jgi:hypothetical protein